MICLVTILLKKGDDATDFFRSVFEEFEKDFSQSKQTRPPTHKVQRPQDIHFSLSVTPKEVYYGCVKTLLVCVKRKCPVCYIQPETKQCAECNGKGFRKVLVRDPIIGDVFQQDDCDTCLGKGHLFQESSMKSCDVCSNTRLVESRKKMSVHVDPGCPEGYNVVFEKEGHDVVTNGETGDFVVTIKCPPLSDEFVKRDEHSNLIVFTEIGAANCLVEGCHFVVKHDGRDETIRVDVPFVLNPKELKKDVMGVCVCVENFGMPLFRELNEFGKLYVFAKVVYPDQPLSVDQLKEVNVCQTQVTTNTTCRSVTVQEFDEIASLFIKSHLKGAKPSFTKLPDQTSNGGGCTHQ